MRGLDSGVLSVRDAALMARRSDPRQMETARRSRRLGRIYGLAVDRPLACRPAGACLLTRLLTQARPCPHLHSRSRPPPAHPPPAPVREMRGARPPVGRLPKNRDADMTPLGGTRRQVATRSALSGLRWMWGQSVVG